jgi:hypothetical protein
MTKERMKGHKVVLSLHDSSFFRYNTKSSIEGLGNIGGKLGNGDETRGFIGHYALAITEEGQPLGLQAVKTWSRAYESEWEKESERWVETLEEAEKLYDDETDQKSNRNLARSGVRSVKFGVIEVKEKIKRENGEQLKWVLYTNLPLETKEDAEKIINYYRLRWQIENYFKVLKGGCCHVEHCNLRTYEKLEKYTMCFSIIAWRMFWMKFLFHTDPELTAKTVLTQTEIDVLKFRHPEKVDKRNFTVADALKLVAMFGGYNNRKNDGPPGNITLWRGFLIVRDRAEFYEDLQSQGKIQ